MGITFTDSGNSVVWYFSLACFDKFNNFPKLCVTTGILHSMLSSQVPNTGPLEAKLRNFLLQGRFKQLLSL